MTDRQGTPASFEVEPLGHFGGLVSGFDFERSTDGGTVQKLKDALSTYQLLVFRDRTVSATEQLRFTLNFGDIEPSVARRPSEHHVKGFPDVLKVSNSPDSPTHSYGLGWHSDGLAYARTPHGATILSCVECPPAVGGTDFASQYDAYNYLSDSARARLADLVWYLPLLPHSEVPPGKALVQPFVRKHPVTSKPFLVFAPQASRIKGLSDVDSARLLEDVRRWQVRDELVYRHAWRPGDLVVWENCALLHRRSEDIQFSQHGRRVMHRSATVGQFEAQECDLNPDALA